MDDADRQKILRNIDVLAQLTEYDELMEKCLQQNLLFIEMREQIELIPDKHMRHIKLIEKITHRGPSAFQQFLSILDASFPEAHRTLEIKYSGLERSLHNRKFQPISPSSLVPPHPIELVTAAVTLPQINAAALPPNVSTLPDKIPTIALSDTSHCPPIDVGGGLKLEFYTKDVTSRRDIEVKHAEKFHSSGKISTYDMKSSKRGILFLVNIINFEKYPQKTRNGASVDRDNLINLFRQMQFQIIYYENITKAQFFALLNTFVTSPFIRGIDCLVFALLSHGDELYGRTTVDFYDETAEIEDIIAKFSNANCVKLIGKPKIFLFPFCRGPISDRGVSSRMQLYSHGVENDSSRMYEEKKREEINVATFSDMKISYGTLPGFQSFRDPQDGSWYIQVLCDVFAEHAHDTHIDDLLKLIGDIVGARRTENMEIQTVSNTDRGFFKTLFFNPGFFG